MKSRTSFFNPTALKKDITRFFPVWGLYTVYLFVMLFNTMTSDAGRLAREIGWLLESMSLVNLIYGGICAAVLFGDLFQPRMAGALHAMPLKREGWFFTHVTAGLLFSLAPNALAAGILLAPLQEYCYMAAIWLAVMTLQFLFFFAVAVFSAMCAGSRLGMLAVYAIIHFFSLLLFVVADQFYKPLLYGVDFSSRLFQFFCPVVWLSQDSYVELQYFYETETFLFGGFNRSQWLYLLVTGAVGLIAFGGGLLLYRHRKLEKAGDFLAIDCLQPVFLVISTLGGGVLLYAMSDLFGFASSYILAAVGILVGYFGARMLMERSVRVFRKKTVLWFAIFGAILTASLFLTAQDPLGITWYVPETQDIRFVRVYHAGDSYLYQDPDAHCFQAESSQQIDRFRQVHSQLAAERQEKTGQTDQVEIFYQLKDGSTLCRYYTVDGTTQAYDTLQTHFSSPEYLFQTEALSALPAKIRYADIQYEYAYEENDLGQTGYESRVLTDPAQLQDLAEAVLADCRAGTMAQSWLFRQDQTPIGWVWLEGNWSENADPTEDSGSSLHLAIYSNNTHTAAFLQTLLEQPAL